jgi:hypothetical protein
LAVSEPSAAESADVPPVRARDVVDLARGGRGKAALGHVDGFVVRKFDERG